MATVPLLVGCEDPMFAPPASDQRHSSALEDTYPIAVWYYVRGYLPEEPVQARDAMTAELAHIRSLGFNTIVADAVTGERRVSLLEVAADQSLRVILPHAPTKEYVRTGRIDSEPVANSMSVIRANVEQVGRFPALLMHFVYDAPNKEVIDRLAEVVQGYRRLDPSHPTFVPMCRNVVAFAKKTGQSVVLWDNFPIAEGAPPGDLRNRRYRGPATHGEALYEIVSQLPEHRHWAMIQALAMPGRIRMPTPAEWSVIHLTALAAGCVDGVVFYRYHTDNENPDTGLALPNHTMTPERTVAIRRFTRRAREWGRMLQGTKPIKTALRVENNHLRAAVLVRPKRQFLLVFNPDVETFGYDTVFLPTTIRGERIARAVNVDKPKRYLPKGNRGEIPIELRLRPGEGMLFELFGP